MTLTGPESSARLWLAGEDAEVGLEDDFYRFSVLSCTTCGQHYYEGFLEDFALLAGAPQGGDLVGERRVWKHLAEELGGNRILFVDRLVASEDEDEIEADDDPGEDTVREVSMLKALCGELVNDVMYDCLQFHGGSGYLRGMTIERMTRDARVQAIGGGASEVMLEEVAKRL